MPRTTPLPLDRFEVIGPSQRAWAIFAFSLAALLGALTLWLQIEVSARHERDIRAAFADRGAGEVTLKRLFPGCTLASSRYAWRLGDAHGVVCAGPGARVSISSDAPAP